MDVSEGCMVDLNNLTVFWIELVGIDTLLNSTRRNHMAKIAYWNTDISGYQWAVFALEILHSIGKHLFSKNFDCHGDTEEQ